MNIISKNAVVSAKAKIGDNVTIKDFAVIEDDVILKDNIIIGTSALICSGTRISSNNHVHHSAVLGSPPQDLKFKGEYTTLEIGENNIFREFVTISRGTTYRNKTVIGNNCFLLAYVHIPHDSIVGNNVIISNAVNMGGHIVIDDWVNIGGMVGIHQFVRIGEHSFIAFLSRVTQDVPPYILAGGNPINYKGLNIIGLKRRGFKEEVINKIKQAYTLIYNSKYNISDAIKAVKEFVEPINEVKKIIEFIETSERGIIRK
jgi:UDP-N-acetylglucosamine acyltransferase